LSPDKKTEVLQKALQEFSEGAAVVIVAIISPFEDESDAFPEILNIVVENISTASPISLNDYLNANVEGLKTFGQDFAIIQPATEITIDGNPAMTLVYTYRNPVDVSFTEKILKAIVIKEDTRYVLTFTSTPETYSVYEPIFEKMLQSFRITN